MNAGKNIPIVESIAAQLQRGVEQVIDIKQIKEVLPVLEEQAAQINVTASQVKELNQTFEYIQAQMNSLIKQYQQAAGQVEAHGHAVQAGAGHITEGLEGIEDLQGDLADQATKLENLWVWIEADPNVLARCLSNPTEYSKKKALQKLDASILAQWGDFIQAELKQRGTEK